MNENIVTMSLEDYTNLVVENHDLKKLVSGVRKKVESEIEEKIMAGRIDNLAIKEEIEKLLDETDWNLLTRFTTASCYTWERISRDNYDIVSVQEVEKIGVSKIKYCLNERLKEIVEDEKDKNE